jgi:hypothetical protein
MDVGGSKRVEMAMSDSGRTDTQKMPMGVAL